MSPDVAALERIARAWRGAVDRPASRARASLVLAVVVASALVARVGTPVARALAALQISVALVAWARQAWVERRAWDDPRVVVARAVAGSDPALAGRTLRAMTLAVEVEADPRLGSAALARLHLARSLAAIDVDRVAAHAALVARRWAIVSLGATLAAAAVLPFDPFRVVEGADVLVARGGVAPVPVEWLEIASLRVHPPEYLHERDFDLADTPNLRVPAGAVVTVRGRPLRASRALVLRHDDDETAFVDDAGGGVVARVTLLAPTTLRVGARFGGVVVPEVSSVAVDVIPDAAPVAAWKGAPKSVRLLETAEIPLEWEATDDHGLREVDLVLRAGAKEERRVLAQPDAGARADRGGYKLRAGDPFLKAAWLPVEVRVEARDDDAVLGPKWGKSEPVVIIPPAVGEAEAMRHEALARFRDALVDLAADRIVAKVSDDAAARREHALHEENATGTALAEADLVVGARFGRLRLPKSARALVRREKSALESSLRAERLATSAKTHDASRVVSERAALAIDAALGALASVDATAIAGRLGAVADDAADAVEAMHRGGAVDAGEGGEARLDASLGVLDAAGGFLSRIGALGHDLGEIVANDLKRARRARGGADLAHAELALRDLAARLRKPHASFSGGSRSKRDSPKGDQRKPEDDDDAADDANDIAREEAALQELARDHASESAETEKAREKLGRSRGGDADEGRRELDELGRREGKLADRAKKLREQGKQRGEGKSESERALERAESEMRAAAKAMREGDAEGAARHQAEAQRELEKAERGDDDGDSDEEGEAEHDSHGKNPHESPDDGGRSDDMAKRAKVPGTDDHKGPEEFRRRVMDGLGKPADARLREAVKRYAEGLLR